MKKRKPNTYREILTRTGWVRYIDSDWTHDEWWQIQQAMKRCVSFAQNRIATAETGALGSCE